MIKPVESIDVPLRRLPHGADLPLPRYATAFSVGADLLAAVDQSVALDPGERILVPTGVSIELPPGYEAQVRPRSGLAIKHGVTCLNSPGTIDADYRGEIGVILINHGSDEFWVERGMRIAQLIIAPVCSARWTETNQLGQSDRGAGGFGSTGTQGGD